MKNKLRKILSVAFSKAPDMSTPEGRSRDRYRRAAWTSLALIAARILNVATGLLIVPITLAYLGEELFGVWGALTGFVAFLAVSDFGLGIGMQNMLIKCHGQEDREKPSLLVANALISLTTIAGILVLAAFFILPWLPWSEIVKCEDPANTPQILPTAQAILVAFAIGLPAALLQRICDAYQRGYFGYSFLALGRLLAFVFVCLVVWLEGPLWLLASGFVAVPYFIFLIGLVLLFWRRAFLRPWPLRVDLGIMKQITGTGFLVLFLHLSHAMINGGPSVLIGFLVDASAVAPFYVTQKLLGAMNLLIAPVLLSLWGAYGEAAERGEWDWIARTLRRARRLTLSLLVVPVIVFLLFGQRIILLWTQEPESVPTWIMLAACVVYYAVRSVGTVYGTFLKGTNRLFYQSMSNLGGALLFGLFGYWWGSYYGSNGIIISMALFGGIVPSALWYLESKWLVEKHLAWVPEKGAADE